MIGGDGLSLADGEGTLSALLAADVYDAAWLADSERLVLARSREINNWSALAEALGPQRTHEVAVKAEAVWATELSRSRPGKAHRCWPAKDRLQALLERRRRRRWLLLFMHLRDHVGGALREKLGTN